MENLLHSGLGTAAAAELLQQGEGGGKQTTKAGCKDPAAPPLGQLGGFSALSALDETTLGIEAKHKELTVGPDPRSNCGPSVG